MSMTMIVESVTTDATVECGELAARFDSFGAYGSNMLAGEGNDCENSISLEKAWHGLHFLLTGDPWGGNGYRAFLLCGGTEQGEDMGYGPARQFDVDEVHEINKILEPMTADELWSKFDPQRMAQADIYGAGWDDEPESELREEFVDYFEQLKEIVAKASSEGNSLRITMT